MATFMVLYEQPRDKVGFEKHYKEVHIPLVNQVQGITRSSINRVVQTQNTDLDLYLVAELEFATPESMDKAMKSEEWQAVLSDAPKLFEYLHKPPTITITE